MLTRKGVILAKTEGTYGTDPTPTVSADAILIKDLDIKPTGETITRDFLRSSLSPLAFVRGLKEVELTFKTEIKGTGTAGSLPATGWEGVLFKACGMRESVTAGTSVIYAPLSSSFPSCTIYGYKDGIYHKVTGCRGTFKLRFEVGKYIEADWTLRGLYTAATDATPATQTFSSTIPPVCLSSGITIGTYSPVATVLEIDINNTLASRKSLNDASGIVEQIITGRTPQGSLDPETVTEATHGFWTAWAAGTSYALNIGPIGSTAGNIITIDAPVIQYRDITYGDRDGILTYSIPFQMSGNSGDDELVITFT